MPSLKQLIRTSIHRLGYNVVRYQPDSATATKASSDNWEQACSEQLSRLSAEPGLDRLVRTAYEVHTVDELAIDALLMLSARTIDETDTVLGKLSQLEHSLQLAHRVRPLGDDWILAALLHDLGKSAALYHPNYAINILGAANLLTGEGPSGEHGFRYSHSEWAYQRFRCFIPESSALLIRYHNLCPDGLNLMAQQHPELASAVRAFKNMEIESKDQYGTSMPLDEALALLKQRFTDHVFRI